MMHVLLNGGQREDRAQREEGEDETVAEAPDRYCGNCGHELSPEDRFCQNCGTPVHQAATVPTPEADVPVPPPPQQETRAQPLEQSEAQPRGRWTAGRLVLGCLGVFFVVFVVGACLAAIGANGGGNEGEKNKGSGGGREATIKPQLVVSSPSDSTTVTRDTVEVTGKVKPVTSDVTVNGQSATLDKDGSFSTPVFLNVGENEIRITAENGTKQAEYSRVVTRKLSEKEIAAEKAAEEAAARKEAAEEAAKNAAVGDTVRVGNVQWKVTDAFLTNQLKSNFGTQKRGRFVVVDFTFTNNRDEEVTLDPELHMVLKDSSGREFGTDLDAYEFMPVDLDIFLEPVNPGVSTDGRVIYEVPSDANGFTLKLDDVELMEDESAVFDLSNIPLQEYDSASASATATASPGQ